MLNSYEHGYAVMGKDLDSYGFEHTDFNTCKQYCRNGDVITKQIPYQNGFSIRITWRKYYHNPIYFKGMYREANIFKLHFNWNAEHTHRTGKIVYTSDLNQD